MHRYKWYLKKSWNIHKKITLNTTIWQKYQKLLIANEFEFLTYNFQSLLESNSKTHQHYIQLLNNKKSMEYKNHKIQNKLCCLLVLFYYSRGGGVGGRKEKLHKQLKWAITFDFVLQFCLIPWRWIFVYMYCPI